MATRYLTTFINHEKDLSKFSVRALHLARVRLALSRFGSPQTGLKIIHIAGSKGKGSTAAFISQILTQAGYTVGLYTSPHLYDLRERFRILGGQSQQNEVFSDIISKKKFTRLIKKVCMQLQTGGDCFRFSDLTYFEVLTVAAFCYFKEEKVDFVVLETGLGGRLDATNVCSSLVAAITPISLEHTRQLGKTFGKIAREKAGIIKKKSAVVLAPQNAEVLEVLKARCRHLGIVPEIVGKDIKTRFISGGLIKQSFNVNGKVFYTTLLGRHQIINAAVAVGIVDALRRLGFGIKEQAVKQGIAKTFWPLRFEIFKGNVPLNQVSAKQKMNDCEYIILDGAHNPDSCRRLAETIRQVFPARKVILIFGSSDDKDVGGMVRYLLPISNTIILTQAQHPRALVWTPRLIDRFFPKGRLVITKSVLEACRLARKVSGGRELILLTGSIFLAAQARKIFRKI